MNPVVMKNVAGREYFFRIGKAFVKTFLKVSSKVIATAFLIFYFF